MGETQNRLAAELAAAKHGAGRWSRLRWVVLALVVAAVALPLLLPRHEGNGTVYKTAEAKRGGLVVTVAATGTLQPVNQVEVGSELSGTIASVEVDYNDQVKEGQVLARLDTNVLAAKLGESRAALQSALAKEQDAAATVTETQLNLKRCQELVPRQMCSQSDVDKLRAAYERAQAGEAMAKAQTAMNRATLSVQETNLQKAVIRSPINGVVLSRAVEPGQTVAASFQTPVLFTLAEDLTKMELLVAVDEADIGQVALGQSATFTVDAYANRTFHAAVTQIRHAPKTIEGVVTYETLLAVDNTDLALLPGMTATADIKVKTIDAALLVPNAALRFTPESTEPRSRPFLFGLFSHRPPTANQGRKELPRGMHRVWVLRNKAPVAIDVRTGATDGSMSEVVEGDIAPGTPLIVDSTTPAGQ